MKKDNITRGSICWLHFHNQAKPGHQYCGDYGYIQAYAKKHCKKVENGELYVKVAVKDIFWFSFCNRVRFVCEVMQIDGTLAYEICVDEPGRLTPIDWQWPDKIQWSVGRRP